MPLEPRPARAALRRWLLPATLLLAASAAQAADTAARAIEQALASAQQEKRGVLLHVAGQTVAGAVTRLEAGQYVELRNAQYGRIVVRLERIDAVAAP